MTAPEMSFIYNRHCENNLVIIMMVSKWITERRLSSVVLGWGIREEYNSFEIPAKHLPALPLLSSFFLSFWIPLFLTPCLAHLLFLSLTFYTLQYLMHLPFFQTSPMWPRPVTLTDNLALLVSCTTGVTKWPPHFLCGRNQSIIACCT